MDRKGCLHLLLFIFLLGNDVADIISDWLFYSDVSLAEKGLVYGEPDQAAVKALLAFSIFGSLAFPFEVVNLGLEFYYQGACCACIDSDVLSMLVVWLEDVPQMIISLYFALCREEPISGFQLSKAILVILGAFIRFCILIFKYCHDKIPKHHKKLKAMIFAGSFVELACAITIFVLINTERGSGSDVVFRTPTSFADETYHESRYFTNVSVFVNVPEYFDAGNLDPDKKDAVVNWLQAVSVNTIRASSEQPAVVSIQYQTNDTNTWSMAVWEKRNTWSSPICFTANQTAGLVTQDAACGSTGTSGISSTTLFVKFRFEPAEGVIKKRIFGQIYFNAKILRGGTCSGVDRYADVVGLDKTNPATLVMHYFRTDEGQKDSRDYLLDNSSNAVRFFRNQQPDLTDVTEIWKTGWNNCETTGSLGPVLDTAMGLECSRN